MVIVREFRSSDLAGAFALDQACFAADIAYSKRELKRFVSGPVAFSIVAEKAGRMAGFLVGEQGIRDDSKSAHVITIDVELAERRTGVASLLMDAAEAHYRGLGCLALSLEVAVDNAGAQAFYKRRGFVMTGTKRGYYNGVLDAFSMSKTIR